MYFCLRWDSSWKHCWDKWREDSRHLAGVLSREGLTGWRYVSRERQKSTQETRGQPHLEQLHAAVLRILILPFDLLLKVQDLGLRVPTHPLEV